MLYKTGFVSISPTVAEWQATQNCVTDRHKIFPLTAIAPILNGGWGQKGIDKNICPLVILTGIDIIIHGKQNVTMTFKDKGQGHST